MPEPRYLFVYGTLRQDSHHPMSQVLQRHARRLGPAVFAGRLYRVSWYPGARDAMQPGEVVHGELYQLLRPGCLQILDDYEGPDFARVQREVRAGPRHYTAWIYLYTPAAADLPRIPGGDFTAITRRGAHTR
ncbi:MAG: gamma-glutamylcyclotransferase [Chromatiales bacterium]|nr:gamma-glutamylcyclotransferase [Chromatiales bacterium]